MPHRIACLLILTLAPLACTDEAQRDPTGTIVTEGAVGVVAMKVGDCFNDPPDAPTEDAATIDEVPGVPCDQPHDNEIFASYRIALDDYPGDEALATLALKGCVERFESFVGTSYEASILDTVPLYPTRKSWARQNDREVMCAIYRGDEEKMTGSMRDAEI